MDYYKKKYDEALERARKLKENPQSVFNEYSPKEGDTICDYIFPELKESEDEKIRKELIEHVKDQQSSFISAPDCRDKYEEEENNKYNSWLVWLEKQGEQKPNKPKFEIGNWIISTLPGIKYPHLITDIQDGYYIFGEDDDHAHIASNDDVFKLWTIADAKDGDVLANDNEIVIFKENNFNQKDLSGCMFVHCSLCSKKGYWYTIGGINPSNYVPATIEQHDLLFSKMKEAGYEWDAENLQLTKILHVKELSDGINIDKQKLAEWSEENEEYNGEDYGIDGLWHAMNILEKTLGKVNGYQTDDGFLSHQCAITAVKKLYKQKPTETAKWSAQEEYCICELEAMIREAWRKAENVRNDITIKKMQELMFFLKTLNPNKKPQRIISAEAKEALYDKPAWTEDDEHRIKLLEALCEDKLFESVPNSTMYEEMKITIDWLKSLRPQPKQKWTEEDKKMFKSLKTLLDDASCYSCTEGVDKILAWLKQKIGE